MQRIVSAFGDGLDVLRTASAQETRHVAATIDLNDYDGFWTVGGDGTLHDVVNGLMRREDPVKIPLGVIPSGTGNTVLRHLGCTDPQEAVRQILDGHSCSLDVMRVTTTNETHYCVNIVGWGGVVDINQTAEKLRRFGSSRYALAALWHIPRARRRGAKLTLDEDVEKDDFLFVMGCNTRFTGKGMLVAPLAKIGDGKIDVVFVRNVSRKEMWKLFLSLFNGSVLELPFVEHRQVRSFAIDSVNADRLNLDGELKGVTPISVDVMPAALRIFASEKDSSGGPTATR